MTLPAAQQAAREPIAAPDVHDMPAEVYHADPCPEPSLSSSDQTAKSGVASPGGLEPPFSA